MRVPVALALVLTVLLAGPAAESKPPVPPPAAAAAVPPATPTPFAAADLAPPGVTAFIHVEQAASIRAALAERPLLAALRQVAAGGDIRRAWHRLAEALGRDDDALFDAWLGRRFTLIVGEAGDATDWALLTHVDRGEADRMVRGLEPRRLAPRSGLPVSELPEHALRLAADGPVYVIGPAGRGRLFDDVIARMTGGPAAGSLADDPALEQARRLGPGCVGVFVRHQGLVGGFSAVTARISGERLALRHAARFENTPFERPLTECRWDPAPLAAFEERALIAAIEPTDIGGGPATSFLETMLGAPLISPAMRRNLGDRRIIAIGEIEGRQEAHGTDLLLPAAAIVLELNDAETGQRDLDTQVVRLVQAVNDMGRGEFFIDVPDIDVLPGDAARHVDVGPALAWFGQDAPLLRSVTLDWAVVRRPGGGGFSVMATHPEHLGRTIEALRADPPVPAHPGRWTSCGTMNGRRVGLHLRSYGDQAALLAEPEPEAIAGFRETMLLLSELAAGIDRCRWQLWRPRRAEEMRLEVQLTLREAESASAPNSPDTE